MKSLPSVVLSLGVLAAAAPASGQIQSWSTDTLSEPRALLASATVGDLTLFAGGGNQAILTISDRVDIFDAATDTWSTASLSQPRFSLCATTLGDLVFFAGGRTGTPTTDRVDVFDSSTGLWSTARPLSAPRVNLAAASVGTKAFFAGGADLSGLGIPFSSDVVDIYDSDLGLPDDPAAWSTATLSVARTELAATTAGNEVLFAGGRDGSVRFDVVDIYDDDTGLWRTEALSEARSLTMGAAASTGTVAVFAGGQLNCCAPFQWSDVVDLYDAQTKTWSTSTLSLARGDVSLAAVGDTVLFAGGGTGLVYTATDLVESYDVGTGQWGPTASLSVPRARIAASATSDARALFGGGGLPSGLSDLGGDTNGINGHPHLRGTGTLLDGEPTTIDLVNGPSGAISLVWISLVSVPFPVAGGTVYANPHVNEILIPLDGSGEFHAAFPWFSGVPSGLALHFQFIIQDTSGGYGFSLSNGLKATAP
ncbi:MAG: Kelch repeat-containing protein [Planctomycetota bacterium]|jgi:hypothetical protein